MLRRSFHDQNNISPRQHKLSNLWEAKNDAKLIGGGETQAGAIVTSCVLQPLDWEKISGDLDMGVQRSDGEAGQ